MEAVASSGQVPEPSPLFWDRFAERVRLATDAEQVPSPGRHGWNWRVLAVSMPALVMLMLLVGYEREMRLAVGELPVLTAPRVDLAPASAKPPVVLDAPVWDEIASLAADVRAYTWQTATPTEGATAEALIEALTAEERSELVRLLKEAIGGGA